MGFTMNKLTLSLAIIVSIVFAPINNAWSGFPPLSVSGQSYLTRTLPMTAVAGQIDLTSNVTGVLPNGNTTGTAANTASTLMLRDGSNQVAATTFTGALVGNATTSTTATNATNVATTATNSTNASFFPAFVASSSSSNQGVDTATGLTFNPSTNTLATTTFSGALTGHASLDLALTGGAITGAVTDSYAGLASAPALTLSGAPFTGGTATTTKPQLNVDSGTSTGWSTSGTVIGANAPSGFTGNLLDAQLDGATKAAIDSTGLLVQTNSTEIVKSGWTASNRWTVNNTTHTTPILQYGSNTGYLNLGPGTFGNDWLISVTNASTNTTPLTNLIPNTSVAPIFNLRNSSNTANNWGAIVFSGSTDKATSFIYGVTTTQTAASETGTLHFGTTNAGTRADAMVLNAAGTLTLPVYTTAGVLVNDTSGNVTSSVTVPIANGGTGQATKAAGFDALSPMSASGDIIYGGTSGTGTRLAKGNNGDVVTLASGLPSWAAPTSAVTGNYSFSYMNSVWSSTSSTFADPTISSGSNTLTSIASSGLTVTAAASNNPGITWTPANTTDVFDLTIKCNVLLNGTANQNTYVQLTDGTTVYDSSSALDPNVVGALGIGHNGVFQAIVATGATSAVTLKLQVKTSNSSTGTIGDTAGTSGRTCTFKLIRIK